MHIIAATHTDLPTVAKFYEKFFDAKLLVCEHNYLELESQILQGKLSFYDVSSFAANFDERVNIPVPNSEDSVSHCEVYVDLKDQFDAIYRMFASSTHPMLADKRPKDWGDEVFYVRDPAGLVLALARNLPHDE